jgi:flagellar basal body-associated protein FliL
MRQENYYKTTKKLIALILALIITWFLVGCSVYTCPTYASHPIYHQRYN